MSGVAALARRSQGSDSSARASKRCECGLFFVTATWHIGVMQQLLHHRVNTLKELSLLPQRRGAEIDLRSCVTQPSSLHLSHDAYHQGEPFAPWLDAWCQKPRGPLLLNTKEDGLEASALALCKQRGVHDVLFLDTQVPTLLKLARAGLGRHLTLRLSAFESAAWLAPWQALPVGQRPRLVWVDCFNAEPLPADSVRALVDFFELCLVSPDLQGDLEADLQRFLPLAHWCSMVCSKRADAWQSLLSQP